MAGVESQWPNQHTQSVCRLSRSKKYKTETEMLQKTNTKISAASLKSVWGNMSLNFTELYMETRHVKLLFLDWPLFARELN